MTYFVRVVRGNVDMALRHLNRLNGVDGTRKLAREHQGYRKPGDIRRSKRSDSLRRAERQSLYRNLNTVFARKARGF